MHNRVILTAKLNERMLEREVDRRASTWYGGDLEINLEVTKSMIKDEKNQ